MCLGKLSLYCTLFINTDIFIFIGSVGQPGGAQVSTTADVLVVPADTQTLKGSKEDIKRKLSQLSDDDVQVGMDYFEILTLP